MSRINAVELLLLLTNVSRTSMKLAPSIGFTLLAALVFATAVGPPVAAEKTTWLPLSRTTREADTLFLPDLSSAEAIEASGGFLHGRHRETLAEVRPLFEFGQGRFGPAVRVKQEDSQYYWVWFPLDGLIPADEFTIQFWAKSDRPWSEGEGGTFLRLASRENEIALRIHEGQFQVNARSPSSKGSWKASIGEAGLKAGQWHAFAVTLRDQVLCVYVDGHKIGSIEEVRFEPLWSDGASGGMGIQLGGAPWRSTNVWISDLQIRRTALVPGESVTLRSLHSTVTVDVERVVRKVPPPYIGSLHPGQKEWPPSEHPGATPQQIRQALQVVRTDKFLQATPMKPGGPDADHPSRGRSGRFSYDWQVVDRTLDWFKSHGVQPYISVDATPSILGGKVLPFEGEKLRTALSRSAGFRPERPTDLDAWQMIVGDFVHHVLREHKTEVPWWGVWNEPDQPGFFDGTVEDYLKLYEVTVRAVKGVDPQAKVGGPESGLGGPWIEALIRHCAETDLPLDFVSFHDYSGDLNTLDLARAHVDRIAEEAGLQTPPPIVIGEFNWSGGNVYKPNWPRFHRDHWHIRAFGAAYTTAYMTRAVELSGFELIVWSHTHYGDPRAGGWAATQLIGPGGEQWAPYNALKGWKTVVGDNVLHSERDLAPGVYALATTDSKTGCVGLVLTNFGFAQRQTRQVSVTLSNLPTGIWQLRRWIVDPEHSSRWNAASDPFQAETLDDLELVEHRGISVQGPSDPVINLELPAWSSTFVELRPGPFPQ